MPKLLDKGLGRIRKSDPNDRRYLMRHAIRRIPEVKTRYWRTGPVMDQGNTNMCVGFAFAQWLASAPRMTKTGPPPRHIYSNAQRLDEIPDDQPYEGTTVRGGAKVMEELGYLKQYVWAYDVATVRDFVLTQGTVIAGTDWYEGMMQTNWLGYIKPEGELIGGHAFLICGFSNFRNAFRIINSWGTDFGHNGRAWLKAEHLQMLLHDYGEAMAGLEEPLVTPIPV